MEENVTDEPLRHEQLEAALAKWNIGGIADLFVTVFGLAAQTHPELLHSALSQVFDLSKVESMMREASIRMTSMVNEAQEMRELIWSVEAQIEAIEKRLDGCITGIERLERKVSTNGMAKAVK